MCHAILRVKYQGDKSAQIMEAKDETDLRQRISTLCENTQVTEIQVYPRKHDLKLSREWKTELYEAPAPTAPKEIVQVKSFGNVTESL